ncbi:MAG TPA: thioesterase family protein [Acidimicrobiales bacterium]
MTIDAPLHPFDEDTEVEARGDGVFDARLTGRWNSLGGVVNGGYYVAVALRALGRVLPHPDPLVVSSFFHRPGKPGPIELHTDVARRGRRLSTGTVRLLQDGRELVRTTASFADLGGAGGAGGAGLDRDGNGGGGVRSIGVAAPDLPPPEDCLDLLAGLELPDATLAQRVEMRAPAPPGWLSGRPSGDPRAELWLRLAGRDADVRSLPLLVDAAAPVVLELGAAGSASVELTTHVRARPAPGWLACRVVTRHVGAGYHEEDLELWDATGRLVAQSRQLAVLLGGSS